MARFTFLMPSDLKAAARQMAAERGMSLSAFIREAVEEWVARREAAGRPGTKHGPLPKARSFGLGASGDREASQRTGRLYRPDPWRTTADGD